MAQLIKYALSIVAPNTRTGRVGEIYAQMAEDMLGGLGKVPEPFTIHSSSPDLLAGIWAILRETLLAGYVEHGLKQTIATTISEINRCKWCVDAHSIVMMASGYGDVVKSALQIDASIHQDSKTATYIQWAAATLSPGATVLLNAPFSPEDAPEIIGCALTFHYLNRVVNALLEETFLPNQWISQPLKRVAGFMFKRHARKKHASGSSLKFLPALEHHVEHQWALDSPTIAKAFAGFDWAMEQASQRVLPTEVRDVIWGHMETWCGEDPGISRQWVNAIVQNVDPEHHAAAKLALLAARASHQIDAKLVAEFRQKYPDSSALVDVIAWGSYLGMRRIETWIASGNGLML